MPVEARMLGDMVPLAKALTEESFSQRFPHPFILGKEVLEEEFMESDLSLHDIEAEK